eukprot:3697476-Pleurochrysis_carterae.AAC.2
MSAAQPQQSISQSAKTTRPNIRGEVFPDVFDGLLPTIQTVSREGFSSSRLKQTLQMPLARAGTPRPSEATLQRAMLSLGRRARRFGCAPDGSWSWRGQKLGRSENEIEQD